MEGQRARGKTADRGGLGRNLAYVTTFLLGKRDVSRRNVDFGLVRHFDSGMMYIYISASQRLPSSTHTTQRSSKDNNT